MQAFDLDRLLTSKLDQPWLEFLRAPSLSMGIYRLKVGQADQQKPHTEDEAFLVFFAPAEGSCPRTS